jgi:hypothetical protein
MTLSSPELRRFVQRALVDASGTVSPDHAQLASAFNALCEQLRTRLQPLFGTAASTALFARALHVATQEFPWLPDVITKDAAERCLANGKAPGDATLSVGRLEEGLATVLADEIALLSTFVGKDLVLPLVQQAWGVARPTEPARSKDDQ